jgi:hypothetical protein
LADHNGAWYGCLAYGSPHNATVTLTHAMDDEARYVVEGIADFLGCAVIDPRVTWRSERETKRGIHAVKIKIERTPLT